MSDLPITIHYQQMEEWLNDRRSVFGKKNKNEFNALLSLAPKLVQLVQYDIPAIQKQTKRCSSSIEECFRVCEDAERVVASTSQKRHRLLLEYELVARDSSDGDASGVESVDALQVAIDRRIEESRRRLTQQLLTFAQEHLGTFGEHYDEIVRRTSGGALGNEGSAFAVDFPWIERLASECHLPVVGDDQDGGNPDIAQEDATDDAPPPQIDWGDGGGDELAAADFGQDNMIMDAVEINWDAAAEVDHVGVASAAAGEDESNAAAAALPPTANGTFFSLDVARTRDRTNLLTELTGCQCFAAERVLAKDNRFADFEIAARSVMEALTTSMEAEFVRMRTNFRERDMFEERVAYFDRAVAAAHARKASHESKRQESTEELAKLEPQLNAVVEAARENRDECLKHLSVIFPGRNIMIVGDINKYL